MTTLLKGQAIAEAINAKRPFESKDWIGTLNSEVCEKCFLEGMYFVHSKASNEVLVQVCAWNGHNNK